MTKKMHIEKFVSQLESGDVIYVKTWSSFVLRYVQSVSPHWKDPDCRVVRVLCSDNPRQGAVVAFVWREDKVVTVERYMKEPSDYTDIIA